MRTVFSVFFFYYGSFRRRTRTAVRERFRARIRRILWVPQSIGRGSGTARRTAIHKCAINENNAVGTFPALGVTAFYYADNPVQFNKFFSFIITFTIK